MSGAPVRLAVVGVGATVAAAAAVELSGVVAGFAQVRWIAPVAAAAVAVPLWWVAVERPRRRGWPRGAVVGAAIVLLAYPLALSLLFLSAAWQEGVPLCLTPEEAIGCLFWLPIISLAFTPAAFDLTGVLPLLIGAVAGAVLTRLPMAS